MCDGIAGTTSVVPYKGATHTRAHTHTHTHTGAMETGWTPLLHVSHLHVRAVIPVAVATLGHHGTMGKVCDETLSTSRPDARNEFYKR